MEKSLAAETLLGGRYKIVEKLGEGAAGAVFLAEDARLKGKRWAVKQIRNPLLSQAEADMLTRLFHPHLPSVADYIEQHGSGYLVMEYVEGESVQQRFERCGRRLPTAEILAIMIQLCDVLAYLHSQKPQPVIHRDLKPSNLLIDRHGRLVLIDFGTARMYKGGGLSDTVQLGTIGFAAPEQYDLAQSDPRTDLYAVGAMLYYLTHQGAFPSFPQIVSLDKERELLPERLAAIIAKLLSAEKSERFQTAEELKRELEALQAELNGRGAGDGGEGGRRVLQSREKSRIVLLLSLFPGAGSTTIGLWLAARLRNMKIPHAYLEHPAIEPQLFARMNGIEEAPPSYEFAVNRILAKKKLTDFEEWRYRETTWYPLPPFGPVAGWGAEQQIRLIYELNVPVVLIDASSAWENPLVEDMIGQADHVVVVARPSRHRMEQARGRIGRAGEWFEKGKKVTAVANGFCPFLYDGHWLSMLPGVSTVRVPQADHRLMVEAEWRGGAAAFDKFACRDDRTLEPIRLLAGRLFPEFRRPVSHWNDWKARWFGRIAAAFRVEGGEA